MQHSIIRLSEVKNDADFRIDAEFYHPEFLKYERSLKRLNWIKLEKISNIQFGTTPSGANFINQGIPFVRSQDFINGYIDTGSLVYISSEEHLGQIKSNLQKNDLLIAAVGATIGAIGLSTISDGNFNQNVARIRIKPEFLSEFLPEFLFAFLKGKFGQYQLRKLNTGNAQSYLNTSKISSFIIVSVKKKFQQKISEVIQKSFLKIDQAKCSYGGAQAILLTELGLIDWRPEHQLTFEPLAKPQGGLRGVAKDAGWLEDRSM